jgi:hypothetical protein
VRLGFSVGGFLGGGGEGSIRGLRQGEEQRSGGEGGQLLIHSAWYDVVCCVSWRVGSLFVRKGFVAVCAGAAAALHYHRRVGAVAQGIVVDRMQQFQLLALDWCYQGCVVPACIGNIRTVGLRGLMRIHDLHT